MDLLVEALNSIGFKAISPKVAFSLHARTFLRRIQWHRTEFANGEDFSQWLIRNELISTVPWDDAGPFVRFSVTFEGKGEEKEQQIVAEIRERLGKYTFEF